MATLQFSYISGCSGRESVHAQYGQKGAIGITSARPPVREPGWSRPTNQKVQYGHECFLLTLGAQECLPHPGAHALAMFDRGRRSRFTFPVAILPISPNSAPLHALAGCGTVIRVMV